MDTADVFKDDVNLLSTDEVVNLEGVSRR